MALKILFTEEATMDIMNVFVDMQATGERIKQLRQERKIKVFELANALGLESEQDEPHGADRIAPSIAGLGVGRDWR
jgi:hypothetical protein